MNNFALVLLIILGCVVTWLLIDTVVYIVKRIKQKRNKKVQEVHKDE